MRSAQELSSDVDFETMFLDATMLEAIFDNATDRVSARYVSVAALIESTKSLEGGTEGEEEFVDSVHRSEDPLHHAARKEHRSFSEFATGRGANIILAFCLVLGVAASAGLSALSHDGEASTPAPVSAPAP
jgi:hypothetical protein